MGRPKFTLKIAPSLRAISTPVYTYLILGPSRPTTPNGIQVQSAV